jgi:HAD superfamily hydrolase (TIGR01509 family)
VSVSGAIDDGNFLRDLVRDAEALLLDFDGPICSVFAGYPAPIVADQLRDILAQGGHASLPKKVHDTADPFEVLQYASTLGPSEAEYVESALTAHEIEAISSAAPTSGAHDLIRKWSANKGSVAIVSNNSSLAVESYLHKHDLRSYVDEVVGRHDSDPGLLKPNPHLLKLAVERLNLEPSACVFIGDSVSDAEASRRAGVTFIGFANKPGKDTSLAFPKTACVITTIEIMTKLA